MMKSLKGSRTEKNVMAAFAGESQARNRYSYYAKQAQKEGYMQIGAIFETTADQERVHAKTLFKFLEGGETEITASFPSGVIGKTLENLKAAVAGERHEHTEMYPEFARVAMEEGYVRIAEVMTAIAVAEKQHDDRYSALIANIEANRVFKRESTQTWQCRNCGYSHEGPEAPGICPACAHPHDYFELQANNW